MSDHEAWAALRRWTLPLGAALALVLLLIGIRLAMAVWFAATDASLLPLLTVLGLGLLGVLDQLRRLRALSDDDVDGGVRQLVRGWRTSLIGLAALGLAPVIGFVLWVAMLPTMVAVPETP